MGDGAVRVGGQNASGQVKFLVKDLSPGDLE